MKKLALLPLALLPLLAAAQTTRQDSLLRAGDLVGGRAARPRAARPATPAADATLARLLHQSVVVNSLSASELPGIYERLLEVTREERRQWSAADWAEASAALGRLNARYEVVRRDLSLEERLRIRTLQGEFRTLEAARRTKDKLDG